MALPTNFNRKDSSESSSPDDFFVTSSQPIKKKKEFNWLLTILVVVGALITVGLVVLFVFMGSSGEKTETFEKKKVMQDIQSGDKGSSLANTSTQNSLEKQKELNEELERIKNDWKEKSLEAAFETDLSEESLYKMILQSSYFLPSEETGFTSNLDELLLEDGTYNPMFSYLTRERFANNATIAVEAVTDSTFGSWVGAQKSTDPDGDFSKEFFSLIFDEDYLTETPNEDLPLLIDWSGNRFGEEELIFRPSVTSVSSSSVSREDGVFIKLIADITYKGKTSSGKTVEKLGVLHLDFISNSQDVEYPRVLITGGNLEVE